MNANVVPPSREASSVGESSHEVIGVKKTGDGPGSSTDELVYGKPLAAVYGEAEFAWLYRASQQLGQTLDLVTIYRALRRLLAEQMSCDCLVVSSYDPATGIVCRYAWQDGGEQDITGFPALPLEAEGRGTQSLVIRSGNSLLLPDYLAHWRTAEHAYTIQEDGALTAGVPDDDAVDVPRSALIVPLKLRQTVCGVLQLFSYRLDDYHPRDLQLVEALAVYLASAQANALLFTQVTAALDAQRQAEAALRAEQAEARRRLEARVQERTRALEAEIAERILVERTLQRQSTELAAANAELARASRLKDEFLANMSHELRTPLTGVLGLTEGLRSGVYGSLSSAQLRVLTLVDESGRHLLGLINDILDLSKIEAGKLAVVIDDVSASDLCRSSLRLVAELAHKKRQRTCYEVQPPDLVVQCDAHRMRQLLVNLLTNAIKFTPDGGELGLRVIADPAVAAVTFEVWDTGIGIAPEQQAEMFQPFTQLDGGLDRQQGGTGLGLALVQRLADLHDGSVTVTSALHAGSSFVVTLPWNPGRSTGA